MTRLAGMLGTRRPTAGTVAGGAGLSSKADAGAPPIERDDAEVVVVTIEARTGRVASARLGDMARGRMSAWPIRKRQTSCTASWTR